MQQFYQLSLYIIISEYHNVFNICTYMNKPVSYIMYTYTHIHIIVYIYIYICKCIYMISICWWLGPQGLTKKESHPDFGWRTSGGRQAQPEAPQVLPHKKKTVFTNRNGAYPLVSSNMAGKSPMNGSLIGKSPVNRPFSSTPWLITGGYSIM